MEYKLLTKGVVVDADEMLAEIELQIIHRPRKSLRYRTPLEYCILFLTLIIEVLFFDLEFTFEITGTLQLKS